MADLRRVCPQCKRRFRPAKATRRLYCETCRPSRLRPGTAEPQQGTDQGAPGVIEARVFSDLELVERHGTVEGLIALSVASDLDSGRVAPAQKPGVGQKLALLLAAALEGTRTPEPDRVDDLATRRAQRAASA